MSTQLSWFMLSIFQSVNATDAVNKHWVLQALRNKSYGPALEAWVDALSCFAELRLIFEASTWLHETCFCVYDSRGLESKIKQRFLSEASYHVTLPKIFSSRVTTWCPFASFHCFQQARLSVRLGPLWCICDTWQQRQDHSFPGSPWIFWVLTCFVTQPGFQRSGWDGYGWISVLQDFKESFSFKPQFNVEEIFGGLRRTCIIQPLLSPLTRFYTCCQKKYARQCLKYKHIRTLRLKSWLGVFRVSTERPIVGYSWWWLHLLLWLDWAGNSEILTWHDMAVLYGTHTFGACVAGRYRLVRRIDVVPKDVIWCYTRDEGDEVNMRKHMETPCFEEQLDQQDALSLLRGLKMATMWFSFAQTPSMCWGCCGLWSPSSWCLISDYKWLKTVLKAP